MSVGLFRSLVGHEADAMRKWARANYKVFEPIQGIWHPVVQLECVLMNMETGYAPAVDVAEHIHALFEQKDES